MILVDMNQISLASVMMHLNITKRDSVDAGMVRHMILNSLRNYRQMFSKDYGEFIICYDSKHYWRRDVFPEYKAGRRKSRETSVHDWDDIFNFLNAFKQEMVDYMPYKVLEVYGAEADDIIAVLCGEFEYDHGKTLILSGDKDFIQLQKYNNVTQYSPITKKFVNGEDPYRYLAEHILRGDKSDGVPNILSDDNCIVSGIRQVPLTKKLLGEWMNGSIPSIHTLRYERNQELIDLRYTPWHLQNAILEQYQEKPKGSRDILPEYFTKNNLTELTKSIGDF